MSYAFLFDQAENSFFGWLAYELKGRNHPLYQLAERLAKARSDEDRIEVCRSSNKQTLNSLVSKIRFFLAIEALREEQAQEDDLVIKYLLKHQLGPETLRFIRLAKSRLESKKFKKSSELHLLYDWTNWEQYYLTRFLPKDRNVQNLAPERARTWIEGLELELIHLGTHYLVSPASEPEVNQLLDWLSKQEVSLADKPVLYLFQKLRLLWQSLIKQGSYHTDLETEVIQALFAAEAVLHRDYFVNLYILTLNYFIRKSQASSQYDDYQRLYSLYEWGLSQEVFPISRQFLLSISNTLLSLAELSSDPQKQQWLEHCEAFIAEHHKALPKEEQQGCRRYIQTHINFLKQNYDAVILPSSSDQVEDPHYSLLSFFLSLQVWYEKGEIAWVRSLLNKKKKATTEWKRLGPKAKSMLADRLEIFSLLLRAKSSQKFDELEELIKKPRPLEGRVWFLQKLAQKREQLK